MNKSRLQARPLRCVFGQQGFSLAELAIALALVGFLMLAILQFVNLLQRKEREIPRQVSLEMRARDGLDNLMESMRMIGTRVLGPQPPGATPTPDPNAPSPEPTQTPGPGPLSQFSIVWAQPFDLLYNGDQRSDWYAVPGGETVPTSLSAPSEPGALTAYLAPELGPPDGSAEQSWAESYRFSLDISGDGLVTNADSSHASGAPELVRRSANPSDYALYLEAWYATSADLDGLVSFPKSLIAPGVRAWTHATDSYPNGDIPPPLFTYWMDESILLEDLNNDTDTRDLLLFGDDGTGDGTPDNGLLEHDEVVALLTENSLGSIGIAVAEAGADANGADTRIAAWRTAKQDAEYSEERIGRMLNRSISKITVRLRIESGVAEPNLVSVFSTSAKPYRYRVANATATVTLYDQVFAYPHTRKYY